MTTSTRLSWATILSIWNNKNIEIKLDRNLISFTSSNKALISKFTPNGIKNVSWYLESMLYHLSWKTRTITLLINLQGENNAATENAGSTMKEGYIWWVFEIEASRGLGKWTLLPLCLYSIIYWLVLVSWVKIGNKTVSLKYAPQFNIQAQ